MKELSVFIDEIGVPYVKGRTKYILKLSATEYGDSNGTRVRITERKCIKRREKSGWISMML